MPLIKSKSKSAFDKNIATEVKAGKPVKQAVAIAYNTKRTAKKAAGGSLNPMNYDSDTDYYEARSRSGLTARPRGYTDADRKAIISGDIYKKQPSKAPDVSRRDPEKERDSMASIERSLAKMRELKQSAKKPVAKKSGGSMKKGCW